MQEPRNLREIGEAIVSACESLGEEMIQNGAFDGTIARSPRWRSRFALLCRAQSVVSERTCSKST